MENVSLIKCNGKICLTFLTPHKLYTSYIFLIHLDWPVVKASNSGINLELNCLSIILLGKLNRIYNTKALFILSTELDLPSPLMKMTPFPKLVFSFILKNVQAHLVFLLMWNNNLIVFNCSVTFKFTISTTATIKLVISTWVVIL